MSNELALHATIERVRTTRKARGGISYRVTFSYPRAFLQYLDELLDATVDVYWNGEKVINASQIKLMSQRPRKNEDPLYLVTLDCNGADTMYNLAQHTDEAGDLRLSVAQMALSLPS